jgi:diguanylate cyclase (GGDEF)-like protein
MSDQRGFSKENRVRLIFLLGDLMEKPTHHSLGGYHGGEDFYALDELLRRHLGRLELVEYKGYGYDSIRQFVLAAPENELLDLIERVPIARFRGVEQRMGRHEAGFSFQKEARTIFDKLDGFLEALGSRARFERSSGKLNRDGFEIARSEPLSSLPKLKELETDIDALLSAGELFSCGLLDLDNFKTVNDRNGHKAGDACLEAAADIIGRVIARRGKLYRFRQGDEFAILLRNFTASEAKATAERIRKQIENEKPGKDIPVTASVGVVSSEVGELDTPAKLLDAADETMYVSKFQGKNRVTAYPVPPEEMEAARAARSEAKGRE